MKKLQWALNAVFLLLIIYLLLPKSEGQAEVNLNESQESNLIAEGNASASQIRYINSDSIYKNFDLVNDLRKDLERRQEEFSSSLESRVKGFEQEVQLFQQNAGNMSQFEGQTKQKELLEKEQELGQMQQNLSEQLRQMEAEMQSKIRSRILGHLEVYKERGIDLVLDYSSNSSVLMAGDSLDISKEVLQALNEAYANEKSEE